MIRSRFVHFAIDITFVGVAVYGAATLIKSKQEQERRKIVLELMATCRARMLKTVSVSEALSLAEELTRLTNLL